jgi:hypothetical protein
MTTAFDGDDYVRRVLEQAERVSAPKQPTTGNSAKHVSEGVSLDNFHAYMPTHAYIYAPTGDMWASASVNARVPAISATDDNGKSKAMPATAWLDRNRPVEQMTWAPGLPKLIRNRLILEGGWIEREGVSVFNLYRPPTIERGDADRAGPWLEHVHTVSRKIPATS